MTDAAIPPGWPAMSIAETYRRLSGPGSPLEVEAGVVYGRPTRIWKNTPPSLRATVEAARAYGERVFLVHEDERVTFEAFYRAVAAFGRELSARGVVKGDRVALILRNIPEWAVAFYGAASVGAIVTPLNAWWTGPELEFGLIDCGAKVLVVDGERQARVASHLANCPALETVYVCRAADGQGAIRLEDIIGPPAAWRDLPDTPQSTVPLACDDDGAIFYTSGTTGKPKGAVLSHRVLNGNIFTAGLGVARAYLRRGEAPPEPDPTAQRSLLLSIPFFHVTGCIAALNPSLMLGAKLVLMRKWDTVQAFELIQRERIQQAGGVPTIAWQLIEHPERENYDLSSLESLTYGGAPSAPDLVRQMRETFPRSLPGNGWGMTETAAAVTNISAEDYVNRPDSCGPPAPVFDLQIRDPADGVTVLAAGEVGELWVSGPIAKGYWNRPEATAETFVDGWLRTGDLARLDDEGFCFIIDRAKDMLIRGGENIYCIEVENALFDHPAVMDAALVGVPHKVLGEEPAAVVTLKPGAVVTEAELQDHVRARLAAFKAPVAVRFWPEMLPRNANGKIMKGDLKALFTQD